MTGSSDESVENAIQRIRENLENVAEKGVLDSNGGISVGYARDLREEVKSYQDELESLLERDEVTRDQYNEIEDLRAKARSIEERLFTRADLNENQSLENIRSEIEKFRSERDQLDSLIEDLTSKRSRYEEELSNVQDKNEQIENTLEEAEELKQTASNLVKGEASEALGKEFSQRKDELASNLKYWMLASLTSISILLWSSWRIYLDISVSQSGFLTTLSKIAIILPISVAVWFSVSNYSEQKQMMREYEFKANMAFSLMGFREVLKDDLPDDQQEKVGEFLIDSIENIYSNPQKNINDGTDESDRTPLTTGQGSLATLIQNLGK